MSLLYVCYLLAYRLTGDRRTALTTQAFLAVNPVFYFLTILGENHMLEFLWFVTGMHFLLRATEDEPGYQSLALAGAAAALAGLTRYTSHVLLPLGLWVAACAGRREGAFRRLLAFGLPFLVVSLPWFVADTIQNGWPLASWQYLNVGFAVVGGPDWWWHTQQYYHGLLDLVVRHPVGYLANVVGNLFENVFYVVTTGSVLFPLFLPAFVYGFVRLDRRELLVVFGAPLLYTGLASQAFVGRLLSLHWVVVLTVLSVELLSPVFDTMASISFGPVGWLTDHRQYVVAAMLVTGAVLTGVYACAYVDDDDYDRGQLADVKEVAETLRQQDGDIEEKQMMAIHPVYAYYAGSGYMNLPQYGDVDGITCYRGLPPEIRRYAYSMTIPPAGPDSNVTADYVVYNVASERAAPRYAFLSRPESPRIPDGFNAVYRSSDVVVYEVDAATVDCA